jgi:multidrug transporter EmrE-like cation transporter
MNTAFYYVLAVVVIEVVANFNLKWYATTNATPYLLGGLVSYVGVIWALIQAMSHENVLYVNALWDGLSGLVQGLAAYIILGDRLKSGQQYVGVVMIIAGVTLLQMGH